MFRDVFTLVNQATESCPNRCVGEPRWPLWEARQPDAFCCITGNSQGLVGPAASLPRWGAAKALHRWCRMSSRDSKCRAAVLLENCLLFSTVSQNWDPNRVLLIKMPPIFQIREYGLLFLSQDPNSGNYILPSEIPSWNSIRSCTCLQCSVPTRVAV